MRNSCREHAGAGSLLVTFKSRLSVPPYRIENMSSDVVIFFAQRGVAHQKSKWNWLTPASGGAKMAYAWDEPILDHVMTIRVRISAHAKHTTAISKPPSTALIVVPMTCSRNPAA